MSILHAGEGVQPFWQLQALSYLKNSFDLSDEELVAHWSENIVWQLFSERDYYEHRLPCDATQIGRFRKALGEDGLELLLKATIDTAVAIDAVKPKDLERVIVDTTVQEKAIAHPVDSRLLEIARHKVVSAAKRAGSSSSRPLPKKAKPCVGRLEATHTPNSSDDYSAYSNASAPSLASSSVKYNAKCKAQTLCLISSNRVWRWRRNWAVSTLVLLATIYLVMLFH
jgi:hypothetical protein